MEIEVPWDEEKWLLLMCDTSAEGVWDRRGAAGGVDELLLSERLKTLILAWQSWHDWADDIHFDQVFDQPFEGVAALGYFIARLVKRELPDWTIVYSDRVKWRHGVERQQHAYKYEITPEMAGLTKQTSTPGPPP